MKSVLDLEVSNVIVSLCVLLVCFKLYKLILKKYIHAYLFVAMVTTLLLYLNLTRPSCDQHLCNNVILDDDGYGYSEVLFTKRELDRMRAHYVDETKSGYMYPDNTKILGNPRRGGYSDSNTERIVNMIKNKIQKEYKRPLFVDYAFLRYYNGRSFNPFEYYHYDSSHYNTDVVQIRVLINLYDRSDGYFSYISKCCKRGEIKKKTREGSVSIIQANKLKHNYRYDNGERLVLVVDLVTSYDRGVYGSVWGTWDYVWDRVQKLITSK